MPFFFFDPTMLLLIPAFALAMWAQIKVKGAYKKFSQLRSVSGLTGAQVARRILDTHGLNDVKVEPVAG
ncbi:MAG: zinc metallopeptidase, partial [Calditrichota bacterium]